MRSPGVFAPKSPFSNFESAETNIRRDVQDKQDASYLANPIILSNLNL